MFVLEVLLTFALPLPLTLHALVEPPPATDESQKLVRRLYNIKPIPVVELNARIFRFWQSAQSRPTTNLLFPQDCQP